MFRCVGRHICGRDGTGQVIIGTQAEVIRQGNLLAGNAVQLAVRGVKAVGNVGKPQWPPVLQQGHEGVGQHLVGAVAHKHLPGLHVEPLGQLGFERFCVRIGVQAQAVVGGVANGLQRQRRRAIRVLVGVELDQAFDAGLLARHIRRQGMNQGAPEAAHGQIPQEKTAKRLCFGMVTGSLPRLCPCAHAPSAPPATVCRSRFPFIRIPSTPFALYRLPFSRFSRICPAACQMQPPQGLPPRLAVPRK